MPHVQFGENSSATATVSVTLTGVANGNTLVVTTWAESGDTTIAVSTTSGSTSAWTNRITQYNAGDFITVETETATATATGDVTIQATSTAATWMGIMVAEANVTAFDSAQYARDTATPYITAATTPSAYDALVYGFDIDWSGTGGQAVSSGWTTLGSGCDYSGTDICIAEYRTYTSGDGQASFTGSGSPHHVCCVILEDASGASVAPLARHLQNLMSN